MPPHAEQPFDSIESTYDFFRLLCEVVIEARRDIEEEIERESGTTSSRRLDALRLASYTLGKLESHVAQSRRILNDLRSLRRLLFEERATPKPVVVSERAAAKLVVVSEPAKIKKPAMPAAVPPMPVSATLHTPLAQVAKVGRVRAKPGSVVAA